MNELGKFPPTPSTRNPLRTSQSDLNLKGDCESGPGANQVKIRFVRRGSEEAGGVGLAGCGPAAPPERLDPTVPKHPKTPAGKPV